LSKAPVPLQAVQSAPVLDGGVSFSSLFSAHVFDLSLVGSLFGRNLSYKLEMKYLAQIMPSLHNQLFGND